MQVVFHMGAHCTDEDQLILSLNRNRDSLASRGVVVPSAGRFRPAIREAVLNLRGAKASVDIQETILGAITDMDDPKRLILSSETFLGATNMVVSDGMFYPRASEKSRWLRNIFPQAACGFMIAIRNPTTFLPALYARQPDVKFGSLMVGTNALDLRWSDLVTRLRDANPDVPLTVWCDEDTPLVWPEVLRAAAGVDPSVPLKGDNDRLRGLMSDTGLERLEDYLERHHPPTVDHRRRIVAAFLDKFALDDALEEELDTPGWTNRNVEDLTKAYEDDTGRITRLDGVTFLSP